jgi:hypothetical protein
MLRLQHINFSNNTNSGVYILRSALIPSVSLVHEMQLPTKVCRLNILL